jgi:hypothetical protein
MIQMNRLEPKQKRGRRRQGWRGQVHKGTKGAFRVLPQCSRVFRRGCNSLSLILVTLALGLSQSAIKGETETRSLPPTPTFESFLRHTPGITNAVYEENDPKVSQPVAAVGSSPHRGQFPERTERFALLYDESNYVLRSVDPPIIGSGGKFGGIRWGIRQLAPDQNFLAQFDEQSNSDASAHPDAELYAWYAAQRFLNLGIYEMVPGSVIWTNDEPRFTATYDMPNAFRLEVKTSANGTPIETNRLPMHGQIVVDLKYERGVPIKAIGATDAGQTFTIVYKYRPEFYAGRFPIEFTRYFDESLDEDGRSYTIRVMELQFATTPIPTEAFDPHQALKGKFVSASMVENGIRFRQTKAGVLVKPQYAQEYRNARERRWVRVATRAAVLMLSTVAALWIYSGVRSKSQNKAQNILH